MEITADKLAKVYLKIRDKRSALKKEYEDADAALEEQQSILSSQLLEMCKATGADSMRTEHGTVIKGKQTRYWTGDWAAMHKFILENEVPHLLERRVAQGAMAEWLENNPDKLPPGLNTDSKFVISVRRSRK